MPCLRSMMARLRVLNWRSASSSVSAASAQTQIVAMGLGLISLIERLFHAATFAEESEKIPDPPDPFPSPKFRTSLAFAVELLNEPALLQLVHEAQIDEILRLGVCGLGIQAGLDLQGVF